VIDDRTCLGIENNQCATQGTEIAASGQSPLAKRKMKRRHAELMLN